MAQVFAISLQQGVLTVGVVQCSIRAFNQSGGIVRAPTKMISDIESKTVPRIPPSERTVAFAYVSAIVLAIIEIILDLGTWVELDIASIYGIPLVLAAFTRNRRLLWGLLVALMLATFVAYALQIPAGAFELHEALFVNRVLDAVALLLTAGLVHVWMLSLDVREAQAQLLEEQNRKLGVANDVLVAHEAQIVSQNEELALRRQEAEEASGRKTRLLNAVSHDIRNPVNTINLMAEVIRRTAEDPALAMQVPQMARRLQSNAQSLVALVSEVLDIAHLDSGLLQRHESTFSLNEFIDAKYRDLAPLAEAKSLQLTSEAPERTVRVRVDRVKLDRIVTNLVTNAIKFTKNGSVTLSAAVAGDGAVAIRVRDTGVGIAGDELGRIFDEFAQFNVPLGKLNGGWGLGLAISRRLANFIGAGISVESELGRGTVFTVQMARECVVDIAPVVLPGSS
jgi:signal transduction histidine kinase